jgi:hypothetical protein
MKITTFAYNPTAMTVTVHESRTAAELASKNQDAYLLTNEASFNGVETSHLLALYNLVAPQVGHEPTKRFATRGAGITRTLKLLGLLAERQGSVVAPAPVADTADASKPAPKPALPKASGDREVLTPRRNPKGIDLDPKPKVFACRANTKQALLVDLLARPQGATFSELYAGMSTLGKPWAAVTVRSGLSWDINYVKGYGVKTEHFNGEQFNKMGRTDEAQQLGFGTEAYDPTLVLPVYKLVLPKGMDAPLPHTPVKGAK